MLKFVLINTLILGIWICRGNILPKYTQICTNTNPCRVINCPAYVDCIIECNGSRNSCLDLQLNAMNARTLTFKSSIVNNANGETNMNYNITCPTQTKALISSKLCDINCVTENSCPNSKINGLNSDRLLITSGYNLAIENSEIICPKYTTVYNKDLKKCVFSGTTQNSLTNISSIKTLQGFKDLNLICQYLNNSVNQSCLSDLQADNFKIECGADYSKSCEISIDNSNKYSCKNQNVGNNINKEACQNSNISPVLENPNNLANPTSTSRKINDVSYVDGVRLYYYIFFFAALFVILIPPLIWFFWAWCIDHSFNFSKEYCCIKEEYKEKLQQNSVNEEDEKTLEEEKSNETDKPEQEKSKTEGEGDEKSVSKTLNSKENKINNNSKSTSSSNSNSNNLNSTLLQKDKKKQKKKNKNVIFKAETKTNTTTLSKLKNKKSSVVSSSGTNENIELEEEDEPPIPKDSKMHKMKLKNSSKSTETTKTQFSNINTSMGSNISESTSKKKKTKQSKSQKDVMSSTPNPVKKKKKSDSAANSKKNLVAEPSSDISDEDIIFEDDYNDPTIFFGDDRKLNDSTKSYKSLSSKSTKVKPKKTAKTTESLKNLKGSANTPKIKKKKKQTRDP